MPSPPRLVFIDVETTGGSAQPHDPNATAAASRAADAAAELLADFQRTEAFRPPFQV